MDDDQDAQSCAQSEEDFKVAGRRGTLRSMVKGSVVKPVSTILE